MTKCSKGALPIVPRPPTLINPNLVKGADTVVIFDVTALMTDTSAGFAGMSLDVIFADTVTLLCRSFDCGRIAMVWENKSVVFGP